MASLLFAATLASCEIGKVTVPPSAPSVVVHAVLNAGAINQETNTGWTIQYNTITLNVPGAGVMAGAGNVLKDNCLTLNGQYGFQSSDVNGFGRDSLTGGPYGVVIEGNEISYNDTCDFSGLLSNKAVGWRNHNPVPVQYRNPKCGKVVGDGNQGGFKLWQTNGVTVSGNYIHNNWGPGGWADTDNANTTWTDNRITEMRERPSLRKSRTTSPSQATTWPGMT